MEARTAPPGFVEPRATPLTGPPFDWPLRPRPVVSRRFDNPEHDWLPGHRGVDLGAAPGSPVLAAGDGIVIFAGTVAGKPVVSLRHDGGLRTTYEPVEPGVTAGARVTRGSPIGTLAGGHEGCPALACLHWGARRDPTIRNRPQYIDPLGLLRLAPLRLKPLVTP
ncbi:M23 family metallopeptidase [Nocardia harenae]|uniref:M23 family metallopeptidase n=1 Tax=Nocardia harenae TaxID=358707 RepID=UPI003F75C0FA